MINYFQQWKNDGKNRKNLLVLTLCINPSFGLALWSLSDPEEKIFCSLNDLWFSQHQFKRNENRSPKKLTWNWFHWFFKSRYFVCVEVYKLSNFFFLFFLFLNKLFEFALVIKLVYFLFTIFFKNNSIPSSPFWSACFDWLFVSE